MEELLIFQLCLGIGTLAVSHPEGYQFLDNESRAVPILMEPKHCDNKDPCPTGSSCVNGFCFWQHCLLHNKTIGTNDRKERTIS